MDVSYWTTCILRIQTYLFRFLRNYKLALSKYTNLENNLLKIVRGPFFCFIFFETQLFILIQGLEGVVQSDAYSANRMMIFWKSSILKGVKIEISSLDCFVYF